MKRLFALILLLAGFASAQTTTTFTGTIKGLDTLTVTAGKVVFTLKPGVDTTVAGSARFVPNAVTCKITATGLKADNATDPCVLQNNTAIEPKGTGYLVSICPYNACTSQFYTYATGGTVDISNIVPTPATAAAYSVVNLFADQTIGGNKTFSGSTVLNALTVGSINGVKVVDGVHYATIGQALAALPANGGTVYLPNGYRETFTSHYDLGDGTAKFVRLLGGDDVTLTCNVTDGTYCFKIFNGSSFEGVKIGRANASVASGFHITYPTTINVANVITNDAAAVGGQAYLTLKNFFINGQDSGGTISNAVVNIENVLGQSVIRDFLVTHFHDTCGVRVASSTGGAGNTGTGPLELINVWVEGSHNAGAAPLCINANNSKTLSGINILGGTYNHPGSGVTAINVDGNGSGFGTVSNVTINTYIENLANGNSIALKLRDVTAVNVVGLHCSILDTDTCIDISESAANRTAGIKVGAIYKASPTGAANLINNHISSDVLVGASIPGYEFGGEAATGQSPLTVSNSVYNFNAGMNGALGGVTPAPAAVTTLTIGGGTAVTKVISATATIDFPNTVAPACSESSDIAVAGAAEGDVVMLGSPQPPTGGSFSAYVKSGGGQVKVRYCAVVTSDPGSATFRVDVLQH